jgi:Type VI secretion system, TssO
MSKPLNLQEHNSAFARFLIFFFVTVAMVASALYFDFQVPKKELQILRERSDLLRNQYIAQENYKRIMNEAIGIINQADSGQNKAMVESALKPKMDALRNTMNLDDSTATQRLHSQIFNLMNLYKNAQFKVGDSKSCDDELTKTKKDLTEAKQRIVELTNSLNLNANMRTPPPVVPQQ